MKTNVKMRVTPEQSKRVQEICFENGVEWNIALNKISHINKPYLAIEPTIIFYKSTEVEYSSISSLFQEIDAELFIRTNGTCEENELKNFIQSQNKIKDGINEWAKQFNDIEQKLKKKNEILKKARIKRKNQREEIHKLNLKLQKCISLEEHNKKIESIEFDLNMFNRSNKLRGDLIEKLKLENTEMCKRIENINEDNANYLSNNILSRDKEIEKLKAVIEYLESKTK